MSCHYCGPSVCYLLIGHIALTFTLIAKLFVATESLAMDHFFVEEITSTGPAQV